MHPDAVIIGGGIVGCACAYYLARNGVNVRLLERGPLGGGASRAGMCHVVTWEEPEPHLALARASNLLYRRLGDELETDLQYRQTGSIAIVEKHESLAAMAAMVERLRAWGLRCGMVDRETLLALEPSLAPDVAGGASFPEDAQVNPLYTTHALARKAQSFGARIEPFTGVTSLEMAAGGGRCTGVIAAGERIPTGTVIVASGAWAGEMAAKAGLSIPIQPRKGTLIITAPVPANFMNCKVILAAGYMDAVRSGGSGVAVAANVQQLAGGHLLLGSSRQFVGFDTTVDPAVVASIVERCMRFFPKLAAATAIRTWAGLRPYTPDLLPVIGPTPGVENLVFAAGHEGIGITEAPITGLLVAQLVTGQPTDISLEPFSPSRFAAPTRA